MYFTWELTYLVELTTIIQLTYITNINMLFIDKYRCLILVQNQNVCNLIFFRYSKWTTIYIWGGYVVFFIYYIHNYFFIFISHKDKIKSKFYIKLTLNQDIFLFLNKKNLWFQSWNSEFFFYRNSIPPLSLPPPLEINGLSLGYERQLRSNLGNNWNEKTPRPD